MNRATIIGHLTRDAELRYTQGGTAVASFTVAVNRPFPNQQGEKETDFLPVVVFKKQAENVANFTKKGSHVGVDGRVQTRSYEKDGRKVYVTEIIADQVQFLDKRSQEPGNAPAPSTPPKPQNNSYQTYPNVSDDDLPF